MINKNGRNTRSAAASGSRFLPQNAPEASEHHKQANMEGTVPTEATEGQNGRDVELASVELARVELANQTGVGKPSSSGDNSDGGVNRDVQHDAGIDFSSKHQSMCGKVVGPRRRDCSTIIAADGKTYKVRKMIALLLLLKHPGLPWKTSGEAAKAIFSSGRHCINKHNKYWKEKMSENYDGIVLVGEFFFTLLQSCGYVDGTPQIDLDALPLPDERDKDKKEATKERVIAKAVVDYMENAKYSKQAVSDLPKKFKKEQIQSFYIHFCGGKESNVSRSKMKLFTNIVLVDKIELSKHVRDKRNETSTKRQKTVPHTETV